MAGTDASTGLGPALRGRLAATRFDVDWVAETGSTNADLLDAAAAGAPDGTALVADHQTAGRGRRGRSWQAPPGSSLLLSVLIRSEIPPERAAALTAAVGLSAREACRAVADVLPGLKWPNDLVVTTPDGERKLGGILAESRVVADRVDAVVVGLGLNVTWPLPVPGELAGIAVALADVSPSDRPIDRGQLVTALLETLEGHLRAVEQGEDSIIWAAWRDGAATLGREVRVETADGTVAGRAEDVTDLGRLVLRVAGGGLTEIDVGDVVHVRRTD